MTSDAVRQQVLGILTSNGVPVSRNEDGSFTVPGPSESGSSVVIIDIAEQGAGPLVTMRSPAVTNLELKGRKAGKVYELLNQLNCSHVMVRWAYYVELGIIGCEYDLLGSTLQEGELMTALVTVAGTADDFDEALIDELGGGETAMDPGGAVA